MERGTHAQKQTQEQAHGQWRRLHPAGLAVALARSAKSFVGVIVTVMVLVGREMTRPGGHDAGGFLGLPPKVAALAVVALLAGFAVVLVPPIVHWMTTRYMPGERELAWRSGLFFRRSRSLAYDRIHAIDSAQPWYLQPFHAVTVRVSAGGTAETDIVLDAVDEGVQLELERLRTEAFRNDSGDGDGNDRTGHANAVVSAVPSTGVEAPGTTQSNMFDTAAGNAAKLIEPVRSDGAHTATPATATNAATRADVSRPAMPSAAANAADATASPAATAAEPIGEPVFRATGRDILLYALSDIAFLASALVLWGFWQKLSDVLPARLMRGAADSVMGILAQGAMAVILLALFTLIVLLMVSVASAIVRFHGFTVWRRGDDLVVSRGLFTRRVSTIPVSRIQTVAIRSNPLRRLLGLRSVRLGLSTNPAAADDDSNDAQTGADVLPVIAADRLWRVLPRMLPEWGLEPPDASRGFTRTGRSLARYYSTIPALALIAASALAAGAVANLTSPWRWIALAAPITAAAWLGSRLMKCRADGFVLLPDGDGLLPGRIMTTGTAGLTWQTLFTRRSRAQSLTRSAPLWRERLGVERVTLPLFVLNGTDEITFLALHRADAERLDAWFEPSR